MSEPAGGVPPEVVAVWQRRLASLDTRRHPAVRPADLSSLIDELIGYGPCATCAELPDERACPRCSAPAFLTHGAPAAGEREAVHRYACLSCRRAGRPPASAYPHA